jgi:HD superfamily phosphodiesterase
MDIRSSPSLLAHLPAIESFARRFYKQLDFAHNESHGERVVANALAIHAHAGGNREIIIAGAWLHQFHDHLEDLNAGLVELSLLPREREQLFEIVSVCRPYKISANASLEAQIVFDADALDLVGPFGCVRELLCNFEYRKQSWQDTVINCRTVQDLFASKLMTRAAQAIAEPLIKSNQRFWESYDVELDRNKLISQ